MTQSEPIRHTVIYRTVRGVDISLDYILPPQLEGEQQGEKKKEKVPVVVWFHGGGLVQGSRKYPYPHLLNAPARHNLCVICADYRLAPQTKFPEILSDLTCLFDFILSPSFARHTSDLVDFDRMVVMGNSAGGWLSLITGLAIGFKGSKVERNREVEKKIKGVVAIYPITSVEDKFWHENQHPVSYYDRVLTSEEMKEHVDPTAQQISEVGADSDRNKLYTYMIQESLLEGLLLEGTTIPPSTYTVAEALRTHSYEVKTLPPIYIVHGTADDKVPHRQSVEVVEALREIGFEGYVYDEKEGLDHSFDAGEKEECKEIWSWVVDKFK